MELKHTAIQVKDVDTANRMIKAYYSNYDSVDSDNDVIVKGIYNKSIAERGPDSSKPRIKHLFNHWDAIGELKELGEDEQGGWFLSKLGRHSLAKDVMMMYEDKIVTEHSHGFEIIRATTETRDGKEVRVLQEGILWEVSSLDKWGANMNTGVKSLDDVRIWEKRMDKLIQALRKGEYTDETMEVFEIQLKQIKQVLTEIRPGVQSTPKEPEQTTHLKEVKPPIINIKFE